MNFYQDINPVLGAFIAASINWGMTALGAAFVFVRREMSKKLLDTMMGFAAGVMIAASFWSLLAPAIAMSADHFIGSWFPAVVGFAVGGIALRCVDKFLPHLHLGMAQSEEGVKTSWRRSTLLIMAITLHNIPEGIVVGVAFGASAYGLGSATLAGAVALAIGIGIQDIPEGLAISMPLRREGFSRWKSFAYGALSGIVEPIGAVIGAMAVGLSQTFLPYALAFAAGAMIFVTVEEVIPESQSSGNSDLATLGTMIGFAVMMALDVGLA